MSDSTKEIINIYVDNLNNFLLTASYQIWTEYTYANRGYRWVDSWYAVGTSEYGTDILDWTPTAEMANTNGDEVLDHGEMFYADFIVREEMSDATPHPFLKHKINAEYGKTYYISVKAKDAAGQESKSTQGFHIVSTPETTIVCTPYLNQVSVDIINNDDTVVGYYIERTYNSDDFTQSDNDNTYYPSVPFQQIGSVRRSGQSTKFTDKQVNASTKYWYRAIPFQYADNKVSTLTYSNTVSTRTGHIDSAVVKNIVATIYSSSQIGLNWEVGNTYNDFTSMTIDRLTKTDGIWSAPLGMGPRGVPQTNYVFGNSRNTHISFYDEGLSPNTVYKYRIALYNAYWPHSTVYYESDEITTPAGSVSYILPSARESSPRLFINEDKLAEIRDNLGLNGITEQYDAEFASKFSNIVEGRLEYFVSGATPLNYRVDPNVFSLNTRVLQLLAAYHIYKADDPDTAIKYYNRAKLELFNKQNVSVTFRSNENTIVLNGHGLRNGEVVRFTTNTGDYPAEISPATDYYVQVVDANKFQIKTSPYEDIVEFSSDGAELYIKDYITGGLCLDVRSDEINVSTTFAIAYDWMYDDLTSDEKEIFRRALTKCLVWWCYHTPDDITMAIQSEAFWFGTNRDELGNNIHRNAPAILVCLALAGEEATFSALKTDNTEYIETVNNMVQTVLGMAITYSKKCCDIFDPSGGYYGGPLYLQSTLPSFIMALWALKDNIGYDLFEILNHEDPKFGEVIAADAKIGKGISEALYLPVYMRLAWGDMPILDVTIDTKTSEFVTNTPHIFEENTCIAFYGNTSNLKINNTPVTPENNYYVKLTGNDYRFKIAVSSGDPAATVAGTSNDLRVYEYWARYDQFKKDNNDEYQHYSETSLQGDSVSYDKLRRTIPSQLMLMPFVYHLANRFNEEELTDKYNCPMWLENKVAWNLYYSNTTNINIISHTKVDDTYSPANYNLPKTKIFKGKQTEIISMINDWNEKYPLQVVARAGGYIYDHAHIDRGNFVLQSNGINWAIDLGYPTLFPNWGGGYWKNEGNKSKAQNHNTIIIEDLNQNNTGYAQSSIVEGANKVTIDLTDCYNHQLYKLVRDLEIMSKSLIVTDHVYLQIPTKITSQFITACNVEISEDKKICKLSKRRWDDTLVYYYAIIQSPSYAVWDVSEVKMPLPDNVANAGEAYRIQIVVPPSEDKYIQVKYELTDNITEPITNFISSTDIIDCTPDGSSLYAQALTEIKNTLSLLSGQDIKQVQSTLDSGTQVELNELVKLIKSTIVDITDLNGNLYSVLNIGLPQDNYADVTDYGYNKVKTITFNVPITGISLTNTDAENTLYYSVDNQSTWDTLAPNTLVDIDTETNSLHVKSDNYKTAWFEYSIKYISSSNSDLVSAIPYVPTPQTASTDYLVGAYYYSGWNDYNKWSVLNNYSDRIPILGYYPEESPEIADWHIRWALTHGIKYFVYNWHYDEKGVVTLDEPIRALNKAKYKELFKFCLVWNNNYDLTKIANIEQYLTNMFQYLSDNYFSKNNYLKVNNRNVLLISDPSNIERGFKNETQKIKTFFDNIRSQYEVYIIGNINKYDDTNTITNYEMEGYDAISAYQLSAPADATDSYSNYLDDLPDIYDCVNVSVDIPFIPVCDAGYDSIPWNNNIEYTLTGKSSLLWKEALLIAKSYVDKAEQKLPFGTKMVLLQAWNEFGEGNYIEPNSGKGFEYLEAVRQVFAPDSVIPDLTLPSDLGKEPYQPKPGTFSAITTTDYKYNGIRNIDFNVLVKSIKIANVDPDGNDIEYSVDGDRWTLLANLNSDSTTLGNIQSLEVRSPDMASMFKYTIQYDEPNYNNPVTEIYPPVPIIPNNDYIVSVYYYPGWHSYNNWSVLEPSATYPQGFSERKPLLGYYREGDPVIADWHYYWALSHGINCFIYDWYYNADYMIELDHAINAMKRSRYGKQMNFCLLWANHWDMSLIESDPESFVYWLCDTWANNYFCKPNYLKINNKNVVYIFAPWEIEKAFGYDDERIYTALISLKEYMRGTDYGDLYLIACVVNTTNAATIAKYEAQGYDAVSMYGNSQPPAPPTAPYTSYVQTLDTRFEAFDTISNLPYIPNVDVGWDNRPWYATSTPTSYRTDKNPGVFESGLAVAKNYLDTRNRLLPEGKKIVTIQAWNEFGEGNYIEPHAEFGFGYLEAIRQTFVPQSINPNIKSPSDIGWTLREWAKLPTDKHEWNLLNPEDREGFYYNNMSSMDFYSRYMNAYINGADPHFRTPDSAINSTIYKTLEFKIRADSSFTNTNGKIYFQHLTGGESEDKTVVFTLIKDSQWHVYSIDMSSNSLWDDDTVKNIRIDPITNTDLQNNWKYICVEYIKLS